MNHLDGKPYWWDDAEPEPAQTGPLPERADAVIVGGGFAGLGAAIPLARGGLDVVVLERDRPGDGASSRNGGITSGNLRFTYTKLKSMFGDEAAKSFYAEGVAARADLKNFIEAEKLDCNYSLSGRFAGAINIDLHDGQKREAEAMHHDIGIETVIVEKADQTDEIGSDYYAGGVVRPDIGGIHPGKFHRGMRTVAEQAGTQIWSDTGVTGITRENNTFVVSTPRGTICADHIIVATNGYTDEGLPWLRRRLVPVISEIIATEPLSPNLMKSLMPKQRMHSETSQLAHYYRPSPDGTKILFGGKRYSNDPIVAREHLRQDMIDIFPELSDVGLTHHWFGFVAFPMDQLPKLTVHKGIIYATGFSGSGTVWARWMGQKAALRVLEREDSATAFETRPFRAIPFYNGNPWFVPFMINWYRFKDRLTGVKR